MGSANIRRAIFFAVVPSNTALIEDQVRVLAGRVTTGLDAAALQVALRFRFIHLHQLEPATCRHEQYLHERLALAHLSFRIGHEFAKYLAADAPTCWDQFVEHAVLAEQRICAFL